MAAAPIAGATKPHHLADVGAALDITLTTEKTGSLEAPCVIRRTTFFQELVVVAGGLNSALSRPGSEFPPSRSRGRAEPSCTRRT
ncbi:hypothetical protein [Streptomyces sp. NPDC010273]|uniref:hypothetical protein n=1 Tax=Streptomyces sp. NPDC010273 TaxID=3364829 RepID=UPI0036F166A7